MTAVALKESSAKTWAMAGAAVAVWAVLGAILAIQHHQRAEPQREWVETKDRLVSEAQTTVKAGLKDPASALFSEERVLGSGPDQRVCGLVNAKNGYGGYSGNDRYLVMAGSAYFGESKPPQVIWSRPEHPCDVF